MTSPSSPTDDPAADRTPPKAPRAFTLLHPLVLPVFLDVLRARRRVIFVLRDSDALGNRYGLADLDNAVVYLDEANTLGEMRATIVHELHHLACPDCSEDDVEAMTAQLLVPLQDALAAHAQDTIEETAERLVVDGRLVRARLRAADVDHLTAGEAG